MLAVLDDTDYRLAEEAARQEVVAAETHARQADSDRRRLNALKSDGSVSPTDDEHAQSGAQTAQATAEAEARKLELAANRLRYTVLRASQRGVVTAVRFEVGQVVAEGQPIVAIANEGEPEIVVDVPEDQLAAFNAAKYKAYLASAPDRNLRGRSARAVATGRCANPNVPGSIEAGERAVCCRSVRPPRSSSSRRLEKRRLRPSPHPRSHRVTGSRRCGWFVMQAPSRWELSS